MLTSIFSTFGFVVRIYSYLCIAYILLSWLNPVRGGFLEEICGPYMNWFRRFKFTQIGMLDFSPILALGALSLLSQVFYQLSVTQHISILAIIFALIRIIWSFFSFILNFMIIVLVIRLILDFSSTYRTGNFTEMLDRFLSPVFVKVHSLLGGRFRSLREQIIICLVFIILLRFLLGAIIGSALTLFTGFTVI